MKRKKVKPVKADALKHYSERALVRAWKAGRVTYSDYMKRRLEIYKNSKV